MRLADGKLTAKIETAHGVSVVGWTANDEYLYVLDNGKIARFEVTTRRESPTAIRPCTGSGNTIHIADAVYIASLDLFVVRGEVGGSNAGIYAVPAKSGIASAIASGKLVVNAMRALSDKRTVAIIASERFDTPEPPAAELTDRLTLYRYPSRKMPMTFSLPVGRGVASLGDLTSDGASAVIPYRDYLPSKPARCHLYAIDLASGSVQRERSVKGGVVVSSLGSGSAFVVIGPSTFATTDLRDFKLRSIPGGPVGAPRGWTISKDRQAVIATYPDAEIHVVDLATGKRRLLWSAAEYGG